MFLSEAEVMDCMKVGMPMPCNHLILIFVLLQPRPLERTLRSTKEHGPLSLVNITDKQKKFLKEGGGSWLDFHG